jgi:hypothetical protein
MTRFRPTHERARASRSKHSSNAIERDLRHDFVVADLHAHGPAQAANEVPNQSRQRLHDTPILLRGHEEMPNFRGLFESGIVNQE